MPKAPSECVQHHLNRFDGLGQSTMNILSKHVQEMELGKVWMVKALVTLLCSDWATIVCMKFGKFPSFSGSGVFKQSGNEDELKNIFS